MKCNCVKKSTEWLFRKYSMLCQHKCESPIIVVKILYTLALVLINTGYQYQYHNSWPSFHAAATFVCIFEIEVYQCDSCWCGWLLLTIINFLYIFNLWIFKGCLFFFNRKSLDIDYRRWHLSLEVNICMTYYIYRYMNINNNKGIYCVLCYDNLLILFFFN
jgi:hypothetical protein